MATIDANKVVTKEQFEAKVAEGFQSTTRIATPAEDTQKLADLFGLSTDAIGETAVGFPNGGETCGSCGRAFTFLDVAETGLKSHSKEFLVDALTGKHGYIVNSESAVQLPRLRPEILPLTVGKYEKKKKKKKKLNAAEKRSTPKNTQNNYPGPHFIFAANETIEMGLPPSFSCAAPISITKDSSTSTQATPKDEVRTGVLARGNLCRPCVEAESPILRPRPTRTIIFHSCGIDISTRKEIGVCGSSAERRLGKKAAVTTATPRPNKAEPEISQRILPMSRPFSQTTLARDFNCNCKSYPTDSVITEINESTILQREALLCVKGRDTSRHKHDIYICNPPESPEDAVANHASQKRGSLHSGHRAGGWNGNAIASLGRNQMLLRIPRVFKEVVEMGRLKESHSRRPRALALTAGEWAEYVVYSGARRPWNEIRVAPDTVKECGHRESLSVRG
ncbi:hypothetical protein DFH06DRAFT_1145273 [Mycena polygramma]|nr:hypothetical protein DFH06DRAFT_1145273 [Mycena polygramma]